MKIFITGTFRSGTTLISHMLNAHSQFTVTYDSVHFMRFAYLRYGKNSLTHKGAIALGHDLHDRLQERFGQGIDLQRFTKEVECLSTINYATVYDLFMQLFLGTENWGEKTVLQWRSAADLYEMFDDILIVHCIRDPRDVLASWKNETIAPGVDYLDAVANCYDSMIWAKKNAKKFDDKYFLLKFEDLLESPHTVLENLCACLSVPFETNMMDPLHFKNKVTKEVWEPNTAFEDKIDNISKIPCGRWKTKLESIDLDYCELVNGTLMDQFGYQRSGRQLTFQDAFLVFSRLYQSPLALEGALRTVHFQEGVQRNPLNHYDPTTWVKDPKKL